SCGLNAEREAPAGLGLPSKRLALAASASGRLVSSWAGRFSGVEASFRRRAEEAASLRPGLLVLVMICPQGLRETEESSLLRSAQSTQATASSSATPKP